MVELSSGVDALYLSARAVPGEELLDRLAHCRGLAEDAAGGIPFRFGPEEFVLEPRSFGRYHFSLKHPLGQVGITPKTKMPAARFQPRAEFIHGAGPGPVVEWFRSLVEAECGPAYLSVSRVDLHSDWQGWGLCGNDRARFVCRAKDRVTYETSEDFTGFQFGKRSSKSVSARIYDKTAESAEQGTDYWPDIWGPSYRHGEPVVRVEFELNREALREYKLETPEDVLGATGALWANLTGNWLTFRVPTDDGTRSRWPVAPEWEQVRRSRVGEGSFGIKRVYDGKRRGQLRSLAPGLVGYLTAFAALSGRGTWEQTEASLGDFVRWYGVLTGKPFDDRVADKAEKYTLL